jgi:hypothetical protein
LIAEPEPEVRAYYQTLFQAWGAHPWRPAQSRFEFVVGAYLSQHAADACARLFYNQVGAEGLNRKWDAVYTMVKDFKRGERRETASACKGASRHQRRYLPASRQTSSGSRNLACRFGSAATPIPRAEGPCLSITSTTQNPPGPTVFEEFSAGRGRGGWD